MNREDIFGVTATFWNNTPKASREITAFITNKTDKFLRNEEGVLLHV
jgi:hypothetical protein